MEGVPEEDRATDIGKTKNLVKIARVVPEISSRTDRHTGTDRAADRHTYDSTLQPLPRAK